MHPVFPHFTMCSLRFYISRAYQALVLCFGFMPIRLSLFTIITLGLNLCDCFSKRERLLTRVSVLPVFPPSALFSIELSLVWVAEVASGALLSHGVSFTTGVGEQTTPLRWLATMRIAHTVCCSLLQRHESQILSLL